MATAERDSTQEWLLPENARPPLLSELEARIDEAMATAKATESAVVTIGAAAIDAAEQARYAAELAERASAMLAGVAPAPGPGAEPAPETRPAPTAAPRPDSDGGSVEGTPPPGPDEALAGDGLGDFNERADRLLTRLQALQGAMG